MDKELRELLKCIVVAVFLVGAIRVGAATIENTPLLTSPLKGSDRVPAGRAGQATANTANMDQIAAYAQGKYSSNTNTRFRNLSTQVDGKQNTLSGDVAGHYHSTDRNRTNHTGTQAATTITEDSTHRFTTDTEKSTWNAKQNAFANATTLNRFGAGPTYNGSPIGSGSGGHIIEDEGVPVTQRTNMNFTGAGVTVSDLGGKTVVNIPSGGGVSSFNSRTGTVSPAEGDYSLTLLQDVILDTPLFRQFIAYNGTSWVNKTVTFADFSSVFGPGSSRFRAYTTAIATALSGKEPANSNIQTHIGTTGTPHVTSGEKSTWNGKQDALGYTPVSNARQTAYSTARQIDLAGKAPLSHTQAISTITGLQTTLNNHSTAINLRYKSGDSPTFGTVTADAVNIPQGANPSTVDIYEGTTYGGLYKAVLTTGDLSQDDTWQFSNAGLYKNGVLYGAGGGVTSFKGRTGAVQPGFDDYSGHYSSKTALDSKDFGVVGDGTTDDSTAVSNAISAAIALNRPVYFRNGVFKTSGNIIINSPITVICENTRFKLSANNPLFDISTNYATFRGVDIEVPDANTAAAVKITTSAARLQGRGWGPMRKVLWHNSRIVATGALNWSQTAGSGEDTTGAFIGIELVADTTGGNCGIDFIDISDTYIEFAATGIKTTVVGAGSAWFNANNFKNIWITGFTKAFEGVNFAGNNINGLYLQHIRGTAAVGLDLTDAENDGNTITMSAWNDSGWETTRSTFKPYHIGGSGNHLTGYSEESTETPAVIAADNTAHLQTWITTESTWPTGSVSGAVNQIADDTTVNGELICSDLKIGTSSTDGYVWTATDAIGNGAWEPVSATSTLNDLGVGTLSPAHRLNVVAEYGTPATTNITFSQDVYGDANRLILRRANGTAAFPTKTVATNTIGSIGARPHSGSAFATANAAGINFTSTEDGNTGFGTLLAFINTPTGTTTATERMRLEADGTLNIHTGTPVTNTNSSKLLVEGKIESRTGGFVFPDGTTQATAVVDAVANGTTKGIAAFTATDFESTSGVISIDYANGQAATSYAKGFLTSGDWSTFYNKVSSQWSTAGSDIYYTTGKVGIGINAPTTAIHVQGATAAAARLMIHDTEDSTSTAGGGSIMLGSTNNNQVMLLGDRLGAFFFQGTSTTTPTMQATAAITAFANQNWATAEFGTDLVFEATLPASNTRAEKMRVSGSGDITTGTGQTVGRTMTTTYGGKATLFQNISAIGRGFFVQRDYGRSNYVRKSITSTGQHSYSIGAVYGGYSSIGVAPTCKAGGYCWIVSQGRAQVYMQNATNCGTEGAYVYVGPVAGQGLCETNFTLATHNAEAGHPLTSTLSGNFLDVFLHWNFTAPAGFSIWAAIRRRKELAEYWEEVLKGDKP